MDTNTHKFNSPIRIESKESKESHYFNSETPNSTTRNLLQKYKNNLIKNQNSPKKLQEFNQLSSKSLNENQVIDQIPPSKKQKLFHSSNKSTSEDSTIFNNLPSIEPIKLPLEDSKLNNLLSSETKTEKLVTLDHQTQIITDEMIIDNKLLSTSDITIQVDLESIKNKIFNSKTKKKTKSLVLTRRLSELDSKLSSQELKEVDKIFKKEEFNKLEVIGQYNSGFIICKRNEEIFIVDQHAADEIFNFENLQKSTTIHSQKLIQPLNLELRTEDILLVKEYLWLFQRNGFDFSFNESEISNGVLKVSLVSLPFSKRTKFEINGI